MYGFQKLVILINHHILEFQKNVTIFHFIFVSVTLFPSVFVDLLLDNFSNVNFYSSESVSLTARTDYRLSNNLFYLVKMGKNYSFSNFPC
jgi:hypothetical protein